MMNYLNILLRVGIMLFSGIPLLITAQTKSSFEELPLDPSSYWNGISASYGDYTTIIEDSVFEFKNKFSRNDYGFGIYESWSGFSYSRMQDSTTAGFGNQHSSITAKGAFNSNNYAVYYLPAGKDTIRLSTSTKLDSVFITNGTYPFLSMKDGDMFSKKFGGESGNDPDWLKLSIIGIKEGVITDTVDFYLADYRDSNNENDYIVKEWTKVDLSILDTVDMIEFSMSSTDNGAYGMNTPAYFCMDNLCGADFESFNYVSGDYWEGKTALIGSYSSTFSSGLVKLPNYYSINDFGAGYMDSWTGFAYSNMQDITTPGYSNQYSAFPGSGAGGTSNYALCFNMYGADTIMLSSEAVLSGLFVSNGTQGVLAMQEGDGFAKKFGGESGKDPDWLLLKINGLYNGSYTDSVSFYLADYRFEDNDEDYIVEDWEWVDLTPLGTIDAVEFRLTSSDVGPYGMNTPAYFFIDEINDQAPVVANPLPDVDVYPWDGDVVFALDSTFSDEDEGDDIKISLLSNLDESIVTATIEDMVLRLEMLDKGGKSTIVLQAESMGRFAYDSLVYTVHGPDDINSTELASPKVFPNPNNGIFQVQYQREEDFQAEIYDLYGHLVYSSPRHSSNRDIDIRYLNAGIYILKTRVGTTIFTQRITKN